MRGQVNEFQMQDQSVSETFDMDNYQPNYLEGNLFKQPITVTEAYTAHHPIDGQTIYMEYQDPLKHVHKMQFQPCNIHMENSHFVKPHSVDGYFRQDGTYVEGYYRDGDGDTSVNRPLEAAGGYTRTNPE